MESCCSGMSVGTAAVDDVQRDAGGQAVVNGVVRLRGGASFRNPSRSDVRQQQKVRAFVDRVQGAI